MAKAVPHLRSLWLESRPTRSLPRQHAPSEVVNFYPLPRGARIQRGWKLLMRCLGVTCAESFGRETPAAAEPVFCQGGLVLAAGLPSHDARGILLLLAHVPHAARDLLHLAAVAISVP